MAPRNTIGRNRFCGDSEPSVALYSFAEDWSDVVFDEPYNVARKASRLSRV